MKLAVFVLTAGVALVAGSATADSLVVAADSQTNSLAVNAKGGTLVNAYVRSQPPGAVCKAFLRFDLSPLPAGATVEKATLRLWVSSVTTEGGVIVRAVNGPWDEATLTAAMSPPLDGATAWGFSVRKADLKHWISVDVTTLVQSWMSGRANDGLALEGSPPTQAPGAPALQQAPPVAFRFDTKENTISSHAPELEVFAAAPPGSVGSGTITGVTAGTGLTGGGTSGDVGLGVSFAGSGAASTVAHSDHNHFGGAFLGAANVWALDIENGAGPGLSVYGTSNGIYAQGSIGLTGVGSQSGVWGLIYNTAGQGVLGEARSTTGTPIGVAGQSAANGGAAAGVRGALTNATATGQGIWGVQGPSPSAYAGWFSGNVTVNGTLAKSAGSFKIDHPLDPENKYLSHSFVESPDMMNIYNGNIVLDGSGEAEVVMPDWFEALNRDFRYQLTAIGAPAAGLYVAREIEGNRFRIAGGAPGLKVSWMVTGVRKDPYAEAHRIPVESMKPKPERGTYMHPELYGQPPERGLEHVREHGAAPEQP